MKTNPTSCPTATIPPQPWRQRGTSLLESIAYLGVSVVIILGAVALLGNAFGGAQSYRITQELTSIRTAVRTLYLGQPYTGTNLNPMLIMGKAFPSSLSVTAPATVKNAFNGDVEVEVINAASFGIKYHGVPQDVCLSVVAGADGWHKITGPGPDVMTFPVTPAAAAAMCTAPGKDPREPVNMKFEAM